MRKSFFLAVVTLAVGPVIHPPVSHAAETKELVCRTLNVADAGFTIVVAADYKTAKVSEETFAGARPVADMDCEVLPTHSFPDSMDNYLVCRQTNPSRAPLIARFIAGGIAGVNYASLRRSIGANDAGGREKEITFGHLECQR